MAISLHLKVNDKLYLRDPEKTELGHKIIDSSIRLIVALGFEDVNFRNLAENLSHCRVPNNW
jgi:hypothetical protein